MGPPDWTRKVYRLRKVPHHITIVADAVNLLSKALDIPQGDVIIYSLASTSNRLESPPSKVATIQLKSVPDWLDLDNKKEEWEIPLLEIPGSGCLLLDSHFLGMTPLNDVIPKLHHTDCIAISGLASHPFGSWQGHDKSFMWIRDEAPRLIPGVRMIMYGYNSQLARSLSFQSIGDISLGLIHQLKTGGWNLPSSKPIIFLAHSLGGIVLKDTIVQIADRQIVASILDRIKGAIMFGVPSLGMNQSHLMMMTEGQPNEFLIQDLSRENGSMYLRNLNTRFEGLSFIKKTKIYWAYETKESPTAAKQPDGSWARNGPPEVLVNTDSATCYNNRKNKIMTIPIDKDHSGIVKFSSGDKDLEIMLEALSDICAQELSPEPSPPPAISYEEEELSLTGKIVRRQDIISPESQKILDLLSQFFKMYDDLYSEELNARVDQIEDPFQDTFKWIFDLPAFCNWLHKGSGIFWINGKPGSGKSTLMKYIYKCRHTWELLHDWSRSTVEVKEVKAGFFFHYRGTPIQKSFEGLLRSLIIQILDQTGTFKRRWKNIDSLQDSERGAFFKFEELRDMLKNYGQGSKKSREKVKEQIKHAKQDLVFSWKNLANVAEDFKSSGRAAATNFLTKVVTEYHGYEGDNITRLERILRLLLDQEVITMDIVLFFDALDEYDGHMDMISRFLTGLVRASTSSTRVKICFSSRPWKSLINTFSSSPGFSLQDYTREDIEEYATGRVIETSRTSPALLSLVPLIVTRASGVFIWVKLATSEILKAARNETRNASLEELEQILRRLPEDLHSFYELIVERITQRHRRYTYALLELIIRQQKPQSVNRVWFAVTISACPTIQHAMEMIESWSEEESEDFDELFLQRKSEIFTWGGGLVEIKSNEIHLMHQTVLEFVMGLSFKKLILGALETLVVENGHSYHVKYLMAKEISRVWNKGPARIRGADETLRSIHYHSQQSEITMGKSQLGFIQSIQQQHLSLFLRPILISSNPDAAVLSFASQYGLALCLRDYVAKNNGLLGHICHETTNYPLLYNLVCQPGADFQDKYIDMTEFLLTNGFSISRDPYFFFALISDIWHKETGKNDTPRRVPLSALYRLATLALHHGQDPDIAINVTLPAGDAWARPLHMVPPSLASELIQRGADVNSQDSQGQSPLDWVLRPPYAFVAPVESASGCERKYQMMKILLNAGAELAPKNQQAIYEWLDKFEQRGFDVESLRHICIERYGAISSDLHFSFSEVLLKVEEEAEEPLQEGKPDQQSNEFPRKRLRYVQEDRLEEARLENDTEAASEVQLELETESSLGTPETKQRGRKGFYHKVRKFLHGK